MILVLGGTTEGRELAKNLQQNGYDCLLSVATELGARLNHDYEPLHVGELTPEALAQLIRAKEITLILDATHPYAQVIKETAQKVAGDLGIPYCRFERPLTVLPLRDDLITVANYKMALKTLQEGTDGIFLMLGVKSLPLFKPLWQKEQRPVWVKVYPTPDSLATCYNLGLQPEQIYAFHGTGSANLMEALLKETGVGWVVTKDSSTVGGTELKINTALKLGIKALIIARPSLSKGRVFYTLEEVLTYLKNWGDQNL